MPESVGDRSSGGEPPPEVRAIISLGSNSARLLIVRSGDDGRLEPVEHVSTGTRLSEGVGERGALAEAARRRTLDAIRDYVDRARAAGAPIVCIATSVMRRASDGEAFGREIEALTGARLHVLDGDEEATHSFLGATYGDSGGGARIAVVDLGGGSIECAVGVDGVPGDRLSVEIGAVRLAERFRATLGAATPEEAHRAAADARTEARAALAPFAGLVPVDQVRMVGGTANTTAAIALEDPAFAPMVRAQGTLPRGVIDAIVERLLDLPLAERLAVRGMVVQRADVLPAGAIILSEALGRLGVTAARIERNDLLLGYLVRTGPTPPGA
jgi:exopolyphosphatase/guanosine-5'-triphosphate,3'-diphosphate pyrophosphatase